tara:strand:+ start:293 stop:1303 length:1011 start_codon:yes stop_codon:yes gene_type:complete
MINNFVLLTGGSGYIGSHTYIALKEKGFEPVIIDNLSNSFKSALENIKKITGTDVIFENVDINDTEKIFKILKNYNILNIIHLAAKKSVHESYKKPIDYYNNNVGGLVSLIKAIETRNRKVNFLFSSSACVYSTNNKIPFNENDKIFSENPYGLSKIFCEKILNTLSSEIFNIGILRYFNPAGSHESGLLGQNEISNFTNLFSIIDNAAFRLINFVPVFGNDYKTKDGTCIRDYFHVMDLAEGHVSALNYLINEKKNFTLNLGNGNGFSVKEIILAYSEFNNLSIPFKICKRRKGDLSIVISSIDMARKKINWLPKYTLEDICTSSFVWKKKLLNR